MADGFVIGYAIGIGAPVALWGCWVAFCFVRMLSA